jgi:hypothetical protein
MILDSYVWKSELKKDLQIVKKHLQKSKFSDESPKNELAAISIEKFTFTSAFIIRKLVESKKLSDEYESTPVQVQSFQRINQENAIHLFNRHRIDEFYDLDNPSKISLSVVNICNTFIHSFVFEIALNDDKDSFGGIFFNSDKTKDTAVFFIQLENYFKVIESVNKDDIIEMHVQLKEGKIRKSRKHLKM